MYVTSTLPRYRRNPVEVSAAAAPHSGLMVLRGREAAGEEEVKGFINKGLFKKLPLPSNAMFYLVDYDTVRRYFFFIPVLGQPLSSNRYYVIHVDGKYKGLASRCATEDNVSYCCGGSCVRRFRPDVKPKPFDHRDETQQFEICSKARDVFIAKPVVPHTFPPTFLRFGFRVFVRNKSVYHLEDDAKGLDESIRSRVPELGSGTNLIVGKWYTPFVFVKEGSLKAQMEKSLFYNVTLERLWEKIYSWENDGKEGKGNVVALDFEVKKEVNFLFGVEVLKGDQIDHEGFIWFGSSGEKLGLSSVILEVMRWLEESVRWTDGVERVERLVEIGGGRGGDGGRWRRFDCYVLVERFALRRMDGTLVLNCDFRHTHEIRIKWE
ncbi:hypothetical protein V6N11_031216 [Hibiscus sabdariffa]|uniref:Uncharacterized protein n=1 Tax=Hibiscus sabdariffa TaxID=183260 RepID=A0ABR2AG99_9ROSI